MTTATHAQAAAQAVTTTIDRDVKRYYEEAGPDYAAWSPAFNMHFGYFRRGLNPFAREPMLEQMNREILARLLVTHLLSPRILDLGCGLAPPYPHHAPRLRRADQARQTAPDHRKH